MTRLVILLATAFVVRRLPATIRSRLDGWSERAARRRLEHRRNATVHAR